MIHLAEQFMLRRVAVLCARKGSIYHEISGCDVYCKRRPVSEFTGSCPVVCHPPCRRWGRLRQFVPESAGADFERYLGMLCADHVRHFGGVLEHPAYSRLWDAARLPYPGEKSPEGVTIAVPQFWWGHRARKSTWLFVARLQLCDLPSVPYRLEGPDMKQCLKMGRGEREHTPIDLAKWLVSVAVMSGDRPRYRWNGTESIPPRDKLKDWLRDRAGAEMKDPSRAELKDSPAAQMKQLHLALDFFGF